MTEPKPHVGDTVGGHLFTVDEKYCSAYYRGVVSKETDKSFLLEDKNWRNNHTKVLKSKHYVVAPPDADPKAVLDAFETIKKTFAAGVKDLRDKLAAEQARQFASSLAALQEAAGTTPEPEEIGTTSTE
jgi:hypothetical protein